MFGLRRGWIGLSKFRLSTIRGPSGVRFLKECTVGDEPSPFAARRLLLSGLAVCSAETVRGQGAQTATSRPTLDATFTLDTKHPDWRARLVFQARYKIQTCYSGSPVDLDGIPDGADPGNVCLKYVSGKLLEGEGRMSDEPAVFTDLGFGALHLGVNHLSEATATRAGGPGASRHNSPR